MATQSYEMAPQTSAIAVFALSVASTVSLQASPSTAAVATFELSGATASFQALPVTAAVAAFALTGATSSFDARPITSAVAAFSLTGATSSFAARPITVAEASFTLSGATKTFSARPVTAAEASFNLTGAQDEHGMSVCDLVDEMLGMCGITCRKQAPGFIIERVIRDINTSLQLVWNNAEGRNYWTNSTLTITLTDGQASSDLPDNVQNVVGPCRLQTTKRQLTPIGTLSELENFADLYLDGGTAAQPLGFHIERLAQAETDPAKCVLHVAPAVSGASIAFLLEVVTEAPRFVVGDLQSCPLVPIPHSYVESLLLPIARYELTTCYLFRKPELKDAIDTNYKRAMVSLGLADPLPGNAGDNVKKREEGKTR